MARQELTDAVWARLAPHLPGKKSDYRARRATADVAALITGFLSKLYCGWREAVPIGVRYRPDLASGIRSISASTNGAAMGFGRFFFNQLADDPDFEYILVDSTIVRAHQHSAGAQKGG